MSRNQVYFQKHNTTIAEVEALLLTCNDDTRMYVDVLTDRLYQAAKRLGVRNFSTVGAREIVIRLIACTNGAILD